MKTSRRIAFAAAAAAVLLGLSACPNPMLGRIQQEIARSRAIDTTYTFLREWGNPNPLYTYTDPIVKVDTAGYFYVTDASFRINKYSSSGALVSTFSVAGANFANGVTDMCFDASGNMYVTTTSNIVQKYSLSGSLLLQFGSPGNGNGQFTFPEGIAVDGSGNIYVSDSSNQRIEKFNASGNYLDQWTGVGKNGTGTAFSGPRSLVIDGSGYIYVVDNGNSRIVKFDSSGNYLAAYGSYGTAASSASATYFAYPQGIARDSSGNFYVADTGNSRVQQFNSSFTWLTEWGTPGNGNGQFSSPSSVGVDSSGNIYVSDGSATNEGRVQKFSSPASVSWVATYGGDARTAPGYVNMSTGLAYDPSGNSWVIDNLNQRVQEFDPNGNYLRYVGTGTSGSANGQFAFTTFPVTPACDSSGNLYVPDTANNRIQEFNSSGSFVKVFVPAGSAQGQVQSPTALAFDTAGNLYIADMGNARIQVVNSSGYYVKSWSWPGTGDSVLGITVDSSGNVYASDYLASRVYKFDPTGNVLAQWGGLGSGNGQFSAPIGVAIDSQGYVYVVDMFNTRIQKFDSSGNFIQKFGTAGMGNGGFGWPVGIAINSTGQIAVSDYRGCLIQEFNPVPPSY